MNLIEELRNDIVNADISLSSALRKSKVLASLLKDGEFSTWVNSELTGYSNFDSIPAYRIVEAINIGTFSSGFGGGIQNAAVPIYKMDDDFKKVHKRVVFESGVRQLESMVEAGTPTLRRKWNAEAVMMWNATFSDSGSMSLVGAHSEVPTSAVVAILDTTRNRLLDFILELQEIDPEIYYSESAIKSLPRDQVHNIFTYTIHGGHNVIASGTTVTQTVTQSIPAKDVDALLALFRAKDIEEKDLEELHKAIEEDGVPGSKSFGKKVSNWIGKMTSKAASGLWKVSLDTAPKVLAEGLSQYYGW